MRLIEIKREFDLLELYVALARQSAARGEYADARTKLEQAGQIARWLVREIAGER